MTDSIFVSNNFGAVGLGLGTFGDINWIADKIVIKDNIGGVAGYSADGTKKLNASEIVFANNQGNNEGARIVNATITCDTLKILHNRSNNNNAFSLQAAAIINTDSMTVSLFGTGENSNFQTGNMRNKNGFGLPYLRYLFSTGATHPGYTGNITGG